MAIDDDKKGIPKIVGITNKQQDKEDELIRQIDSVARHQKLQDEGKEVPKISEPANAPESTQKSGISKIKNMFLLGAGSLLFLPGMYGVYSMKYRTPTVIETREYTADNGSKKITAKIIGHDERYPGIRSLDNFLHGFFKNKAYMKIDHFEDFIETPMEYTIKVDIRPLQEDAKFTAKNWKRIKQNAMLCKKGHEGCDRSFLPAKHALENIDERFIEQASLEQYLDSDLQHEFGHIIYGTKDESIAHYHTILNSSVRAFERLEQYIHPKYGIAEKVDGTRKKISRSTRDTAKEVLGCIAYEGGFESIKKIDYSNHQKLRGAASRCLVQKTPNKRLLDTRYINKNAQKRFSGYRKGRR